VKFCYFHLMPYRFLPDRFETDYRSVWVEHLESPAAVAREITEFS
jgi:hypothetical protein